MLNREESSEAEFVYFWSVLPSTESSFRKEWIKAEEGTHQCEEGHMTGEF